ncbi:NADP-dependent oxidoreductase [Terriglobus albidus]|uniref:NADP-dependent oxidoreductase n=1 Tax=Terriglobus albidus TaxID=1592106 RepID=UPI0021E04E19|nr:NADP-dependent oxidoreductase [Terriglobus albidus]
MCITAATDAIQTFEFALTEVDTPTCGEGEILIRVHAAAITPSELLWYPTTHTKEGNPRVRPIPGHEFSGTVAAVGSGVTGMVPGQAIFGMNDWFANGALAEFCITRPEMVAIMPKNLSFAAAASVPISALTAWQGLFDRGNLRAGEKVLVLGGSGAVGAYVIQLARMHGAEILATASMGKHDFVKNLGAERVIHPSKDGLADIGAGMDVIFDTVGGNLLEQAWPLLREGGRMVTIVEENSQDPRQKAAFFIVHGDRTQLSDIAMLLDAGYLTPYVAAEIDLERVPAAFTGREIRGDRPGKVVLTMGEQS